MIIRTMGGEIRIRNKAGLLQFLSGKTNKSGQTTEDIEVVAPAPFCLASADGEGTTGVAWTFSTFDLDRYGERVDPAGWDYKRYMDNPVVQWAHRYDIPAIGQADGLYTDDKGLHGSIVFNDKDYDHFGWAIGQRVKAGVIRAGSVGFRVIEIEIPSKADGADGTCLIFRKQELLEFSICNVPANPFALAKSTLAIDCADITPDLSSPTFWGGLINNF
jgi:HK97 family phage prohead protease